METSDLNSPGYWESKSIDLRLNPRRAVDAGGLSDFLADEIGIRAAVVLASSGSGGVAKFVVLSKAALLASARAVNAHCGLDHADIWLGGLSTFHVGGIGIHARAFCSGAKVVPMAWDSWRRDGSALIEAVETSGATLTSLTPTHLADLVTARRRCPESLRGVFLGGGRIGAEVFSAGIELGWPLWPTYGMSETASQVATSTSGDPEWLPLLPVWEARCGEDDRLWLRGDALAEGTAMKSGGEWCFVRTRDADGWFRSADACELRDGRIRFVRRLDDAVKVSGELVSLDALTARLAGLGVAGLVVALPDPRREHELVLVCEGGPSLQVINQDLPPIEQIQRIVPVARLPRTELGKPDWSAITAIAQGDGSFHATG